jgi:hypothetical protein
MFATIARKGRKIYVKYIYAWNQLYKIWYCSIIQSLIEIDQIVRALLPVDEHDKTKLLSNFVFQMHKINSYISDTLKAKFWLSVSTRRKYLVVENVKCITNTSSRIKSLLNYKGYRCIKTKNYRRNV